MNVVVTLLASTKLIAVPVRSPTTRLYALAVEPANAENVPTRCDIGTDPAFDRVMESPATEAIEDCDVGVFASADTEKRATAIAAEWSSRMVRWFTISSFKSSPGSFPFAR